MMAWLRGFLWWSCEPYRRQACFCRGGDAAYRYDQTPDATKPALGGFCFASYLVGRGKLKRYGMYMILKDNADFIFLMEYQLECC
jgi:hypothetical protein